MNVTMRNWKSDTGNVMYKEVQAEDSKEREDEKEAKVQADQDIYEQSSSLDSLLKQSSESDSSGYKVKSSTPNDTVGQLAAELARAVSRMDVQQVASKAMRALANLKMSSMSCDESEKKKIAQRIKRMEKLIKRISKKMQHLSKEEQIELQKRQAEKKEEIQKAKELGEELRGRRNKRRRDERNYAFKELAEDGKEATKETISSMSGAVAASSPYSDISAPSVEGVSVDMTV